MGKLTNTPKTIGQLRPGVIHRSVKRAEPVARSTPSQVDLELLAKKGGLERFFDFIALGREPKQAWLFLKKNKTKLHPKDGAIQQDP